MSLTTWFLRVLSATVVEERITKPQRTELDRLLEQRQPAHPDQNALKRNAKRKRVRISLIIQSKCPRAHLPFRADKGKQNQKEKVMTNREFKRSPEIRSARMGQTWQLGQKEFSMWSSCLGNGTYLMDNWRLTLMATGATGCHWSVSHDRTAKPLRSKRCSDGG